jgi:hypothetical protein
VLLALASEYLFLIARFHQSPTLPPRSPADALGRAGDCEFDSS